MTDEKRILVTGATGKAGRLFIDRCAEAMNDARVINDAHVPTFLLCAQTEFDVLTIEPITLAQRPHRTPHVGAERHRRAAHPIDRARHIRRRDAPHEPCELSRATDDADHPQKCRRSSSTPLRRSVFVEKSRAGDAESPIIIESR